MGCWLAWRAGHCTLRYLAPVAGLSASVSSPGAGRRTGGLGLAPRGRRTVSSNKSLREPPRFRRQRAPEQTELEEPIRAELFSVERLEQHAQTLAAAQAVTNMPRQGHAVGASHPRERTCPGRAYRVLARAIKDERTITPAAEWLVDNFPIVDEQLREIRDDLPPDYYRELPKLAEGHLDGYPRVWAWPGRTSPTPTAGSTREPAPVGAGLPGGGAADDRRALGHRHQPAHPAGREPPAAGRADRARRAARRARRRARRRLLGLVGTAAEVAPASLQRLSAHRAPDGGRASSSSSACATRTRRSLLRCAGSRSCWRRRARPPRRLVRLEHQRQATMNVTVRNVITSMRLISWFDWADFVESVSLVDEVLRDPAARSARWTSPRATATGTPSRSSPGFGLHRARGRPSRRSRWPTRTPADGDDARRARVGDPGYYLISGGRYRSGACARRPGAVRGRRLRRAYVRAARVGYLGPIALVTALLVAACRLLLAAVGGPIGAWVARRGHPRARARLRPGGRPRQSGGHPSLGPRPLPRLDLDAGVPTELRTLVAVPMLLTSDGGGRGAGRRPWRCTTSRNRDGDLRFALLSDWLDAPTRAGARRRRAARRGRWRGSTGSTSATARPRAVERASCSSIAAPLERGRGLLDGLGAQARQAARAQRATARLDDHELPDAATGGVDAAVATCATSSRSMPTPGCRGVGAAARRDDGPPAQSTGLRSCRPAG